VDYVYPYTDEWKGCRSCTHYRETGGTHPDDPDIPWPSCAAFPAGVPPAVFVGVNPHLDPIEGDSGITFTLKTE
jgi:hypothetical protein